MSLRRLCNLVHGMLLDGCADEEERDALDARLLAAPGPVGPQSSEAFSAMVRAAGGEMGE